MSANVWRVGGLPVVVFATGALAHAQEVTQGVDLHGEIAPVPTGHPSQPTTTLGAPLGIDGAWGVSLLGEFANDPARLTERALPGVDTVSRPLVDGFAMVHAGGFYGLSRRLTLAGDLPVYLTAANYASEMPTVGDLSLRATWGLVLPREDLTGASFGVMPVLTLPTGNGQRLVGNELALAGHAVGGVRGRTTAFDAHLGLRLREEAELPSQRFGGLQIPWGLSAGVRLIEPVWARVELRGMSDPGALPDVDGVGTATTLEGMVSVAGRFGAAWSSGALGTGLTSGIGAARSRGFLGVGWSHLPVPAPMPEVIPRVTLRVEGGDGNPLAGAVVRRGSEVLGITDASGQLPIDRPRRWPSDLTVEAPGHRSAAVAAPEEEATEATVTLGWAPAVLQARVTDPGGQVLTDATLKARPVRGGDVLSGSPEGLELTPGLWEVTVAAPGRAAQRRVVRVDADGRPPTGFEAVLVPPVGEQELVLAVVDAANRPVPEARVLVDGLPVGTVAGGALVALEGLGPGDLEVEVQHPAYTSVVVDATPGTPRTVVLTRVPGSVRVVAVGPDGLPVDDAIVRFLGPSRLAPASLGARGERVQVLSPGTWDVLVSSPSYGLQRRTIEVAADQYAMLTVEVQLQAAEGGDADLRVTVVDGSSIPVPDAEVRLDDVPFGLTSTGGSLELLGLAQGARDLVVVGELLRPVPPRSVDLVAGVVDAVVPVRWVEGAVEVRVTGPDGPVDDALVRFLGAETRTLDIGADGVERTVLPPGAWTVLASSPTLGLQQRSLTIEADSDRLHRVEVVLTPPEGGLADLGLSVVDPDGRSVPGATVALDGVALGATGPMGDLKLEGLGLGQRQLEVVGPLHEVAGRSVQLMEGLQEVEVELGWAPGVVRVSVVAEGAPVPDAVVRMMGPVAMAPATVDAAGQHTTRLTPGAWQVLVSSPTWGVAATPLQIPEGLADRLDVEVVMAAPSQGVATLALTVRDGDGHGVVGADVRIGGRSVGTTGDGGLALLEGLSPGKALVEVVHPLHDGWSAKVPVGDGATERVVALDWVEQPLEVVVVGLDGQPAPGASVQLVGPADVPAATADAEGRARFAVRPGAWQVIAQQPGLGPVRQAVQVGAEPPAVQRLALEEGELRVTDKAIDLRRQVLFGFDSATLSSEADPILDQVASILLGSGALRVEVQGHSDDVGDLAYNQELSSRRARSVMQALVARGVPAETLVARGYGSQRPVGDNATEAGRAANRRVQFEIVERGAASP